MLNEENPIAQYIIVRDDLGMSRGKMCAQASHCVGMLFLKYAEVKNQKEGYLFKEWLKTGMRKIVLAADSREWSKIEAQFGEDPFAYITHDAGVTEVEAGTATACAIFPMHKKDAPKTIKRLQTLK